MMWRDGGAHQDGRGSPVLLESIGIYCTCTDDGSVTVTGIQQGAAAAFSGQVAVGDVIVSIDDSRPRSTSDASRLSSGTPDTLCRLLLQRYGEPTPATLILMRQSPTDLPATVPLQSTSALGARVVPDPSGRGMLVCGIYEGGSAYWSDLKLSDIITTVDGTPVLNASPQDMARLTTGAVGTRMLLRVIRARPIAGSPSPASPYSPRNNSSISGVTVGDMEVSVTVRVVRCVRGEGEALEGALAYRRRLLKQLHSHIHSALHSSPSKASTVNSGRQDVEDRNAGDSSFKMAGGGRSKSPLISSHSTHGGEGDAVSSPFHFEESPIKRATPPLSAYPRPSASNESTAVAPAAAAAAAAAAAQVADGKSSGPPRPEGDVRDEGGGGIAPILQIGDAAQATGGGTSNGSSAHGDGIGISAVVGGGGGGGGGGSLSSASSTSMQPARRAIEPLSPSPKPPASHTLNPPSTFPSPSPAPLPPQATAVTTSAATASADASNVPAPAPQSSTPSSSAAWAPSPEVGVIVSAARGTTLPEAQKILSQCAWCVGAPESAFELASAKGHVVRFNIKGEGGWAHAQALVAQMSHPHSPIHTADATCLLTDISIGRPWTSENMGRGGGGDLDWDDDVRQGEHFGESIGRTESGAVVLPQRLASGSVSVNLSGSVGGGLRMTDQLVDLSLNMGEGVGSGVRATSESFGEGTGAGLASVGDFQRKRDYELGSQSGAGRGGGVGGGVVGGAGVKEEGEEEEEEERGLTWFHANENINDMVRIVSLAVRNINERSPSKERIPPSDDDEYHGRGGGAVAEPSPSAQLSALAGGWDLDDGQTSYMGSLRGGGSSTTRGRNPRSSAPSDDWAVRGLEFASPVPPPPPEPVGVRVRMGADPVKVAADEAVFAMDLLATCAWCVNSSTDRFEYCGIEPTTEGEWGVVAKVNVRGDTSKAGGGVPPFELAQLLARQVEEQEGGGQGVEADMDVEGGGGVFVLLEPSNPHPPVSVERGGRGMEGGREGGDGRKYRSLPAYGSDPGAGGGALLKSGPPKLRSPPRDHKRALPPRDTQRVLGGMSGAGHHVTPAQRRGLYQTDSSDSDESPSVASRAYSLPVYQTNTPGYEYRTASGEGRLDDDEAVEKRIHSMWERAHTPPSGRRGVGREEGGELWYEKEEWYTQAWVKQQGGGGVIGKTVASRKGEGVGGEVAVSKGGAVETARDGEPGSEEVQGAPVEGGGVGVLGGADERSRGRRGSKAATKAKRGAPGDSDSD